MKNRVHTRQVHQPLSTHSRRVRNVSHMVVRVQISHHRSKRTMLNVQRIIRPGSLRVLQRTRTTPLRLVGRPSNRHIIRTRSHVQAQHVQVIRRPHRHVTTTKLRPVHIASRPPVSLRTALLVNRRVTTNARHTNNFKPQLTINVQTYILHNTTSRHSPATSQVRRHPRHNTCNLRIQRHSPVNRSLHVMVTRGRRQVQLIRCHTVHSQQTRRRGPTIHNRLLHLQSHLHRTTNTIMNVNSRHMPTKAYHHRSTINRVKRRQLTRVNSNRSSRLHTTNFRNTNKRIGTMSRTFSNVLSALTHLQTRATNIIRRVQRHFSKSTHLTHRINSNRPFHRDAPLITPSNVFHAIRTRHPSSSDVAHFPQPIQSLPPNPKDGNHTVHPSPRQATQPVTSLSIRNNPARQQRKSTSRTKLNVMRNQPINIQNRAILIMRHVHNRRVIIIRHLHLSKYQLHTILRPSLRLNNHLRQAIRHGRNRQTINTTRNRNIRTISLTVTQHVRNTNKRLQLRRNTTLNRTHNRKRQIRHNLTPNQTTQLHRSQNSSVSRLHRTNNTRTINILRRHSRRVTRRRNINNNMSILRRAQNRQPITSTLKNLTQLLALMPSVPFVRQSMRIIHTLRVNLNNISNNNRILSRTIRVRTKNRRTNRITHTILLRRQLMMNITKSRIRILMNLLGGNLLPLTRNQRTVNKKTTRRRFRIQVSLTRTNNRKNNRRTMILNKLITRLPQTIRLITRTPRTSVRQLINTINTTAFQRLNTTKRIHMLRRIRNLLRTTHTRISNLRRLITTNNLGPFNRLIRTRFINFNKVPNRVRSAKAFLLKTSTILPTMTKRRITTQMTSNNNTRFLSRISSILTRTILINNQIIKLMSTNMRTATGILSRQARRAVISQDSLGVIVSSRAYNRVILLKRKVPFCVSTYALRA